MIAIIAGLALAVHAARCTPRSSRFGHGLSSRSRAWPDQRRRESAPAAFAAGPANLLGEFDQSGGGVAAAAGDQPLDYAQRWQQRACRARVAADRDESVAMRERRNQRNPLGIGRVLELDRTAGPVSTGEHGEHVFDAAIAEPRIDRRS